MTQELKPAEYQERIIKALVKAYNDPVNAYARTAGIDEPRLATASGFCSPQGWNDGSVRKDFREALKQMMSRDWITVANQVAIGNWSGIKPTHVGITHGRSLMRPCYRKAFDAIKGDVRTILVAVITAVLVTLLTNWLLKLFA